MKEQFKAARRAAVPIIAIETADQQDVIKGLAKCNNTVPIIQWDVIKGLSPINQAGMEIVTKLCGGDDPAMSTGNPAEFLGKISTVPKETIIFMNNAHRFIANESVSQGICNLRDIFKSNGANSLRY